jgi:hypothetical protein
MANVVLLISAMQQCSNAAMTKGKEDWWKGKLIISRKYKYLRILH